MAKRNGNRELRKPKQNKPKAAAAASVSELSRTARPIVAKRK